VIAAITAQDNDGCKLTASTRHVSCVESVFGMGPHDQVQASSTVKKRTDLLTQTRSATRQGGGVSNHRQELGGAGMRGRPPRQLHCNGIESFWSLLKPGLHGQLCGGGTGAPVTSLAAAAVAGRGANRCTAGVAWA